MFKVWHGARGDWFSHAIHHAAARHFPDRRRRRLPLDAENCSNLRKVQFILHQRTIHYIVHEYLLRKGEHCRSSSRVQPTAPNFVCSAVYVLFWAIFPDKCFTAIESLELLVLLEEVWVKPTLL